MHPGGRKTCVFFPRRYKNMVEEWCTNRMRITQLHCEKTSRTAWPTPSWSVNWKILINAKKSPALLLEGVWRHNPEGDRLEIDRVGVLWNKEGTYLGADNRLTIGQHFQKNVKNVRMARMKPYPLVANGSGPVTSSLDHQIYASVVVEVSITGLLGLRWEMPPTETERGQEEDVKLVSPIWETTRTNIR